MVKVVILVLVPDLGGKSFQSFTTEFLLLLSQFFINVLYHVKEVAFYF